MFNVKEIRELIEIIDKSNVSELELEKKDERIRIKKNITSNGLTSFVQNIPVTSEVETKIKSPVEVVNPNVNSQKPTELGTAISEKKEPVDYLEIKSPMVGTFYAAPSPDAEAYVKVGNVVSENDVVCIIEAMKLMNEIEADAGGKVIEICVVNGQLVEYGQTLFKLAKE